MYELKKKFGNVFMSKFVGTGPSSYGKRIYWAAVSRRLRNAGLEHAVVMKSLQMEVTSEKASICPRTVFMTLQPADYVHKLHTYVTDSIRRKRRFKPQAFLGQV